MCLVSIRDCCNHVIANKLGCLWMQDGDYFLRSLLKIHLHMPRTIYTGTTCPLKLERGAGSSLSAWIKNISRPWSNVMVMNPTLKLRRDLDDHYPITHLNPPLKQPVLSWDSLGRKFFQISKPTLASLEILSLAKAMPPVIPRSRPAPSSTQHTSSI